MSSKLAEKIILKIVKEKKILSETLFWKKIRKICSQEKQPPISKVDLLTAYRSLLRKKQIKENKTLEFFLRRRKVRTISGVAVISVLTKPYPCPGKCVYCPLENEIPKSYLSNEPAVMRAILNKFNPYNQVQSRLRSLYKTGHPTDKIELIVMGGTWSVLPKQYQTWFIKRCFQAANDFPKSKKTSELQKQSLEKAQKINEKAKHRIIGLTLETRPDYITEKEVKRMRKFGCTRVELGIQSLDNKILKLNKRGHGTKEIIKATQLLKDAGFKICYHLMPNLPGSSPKKDLETFKKLFQQPEYQPDMLKIYPTVVIKGSQLYNWWKKGLYKSYSQKTLLELLIKIKQIIPPYVRINRLIRDIPAPSIEEGNKISNLREVVQKEMAKRGLKCSCIRCREIRGEKFSFQNIRFKQIIYPASQGKEYFISYEDVKQDKLLAFLRLRFPSQKTNPLFPELNNASLVRELHTYGFLVPLGKENIKSAQHLGLGRKLMKKAEKISQKNGYKKIAVISGIGVREYYRKLGYRLEGYYMVKNLK